MANKAFLIAVILATLLIGFFLGFYIRDLQSRGGSIDLNPIAKSCQYGGKTYKSGEGFPSEDGCNSCSCEDGKVSCTLMACE